LREDGTVWAWGDNGVGRLGRGDYGDYATEPVQVINLDSVIAIAAGASDSFAIRDDSTVWGWGRNQDGELGDGTTRNQHTPVQVLGINDAVSVAGGNYHSLAIRQDGTVWAWGKNRFGELGDGRTTDSTRPVQVKGLSSGMSIAAGRFHSQAIKSDGTIWSWGWNGVGQLGLGRSVVFDQPIAVTLTHWVPYLGNVLFIEKSGAHVVLSFPGTPVLSVTVYGDMDKTSIGLTALSSFMTAQDYTHMDAAGAPDNYFYRLTGVDACP
ncbi:RCC1 domain-containing protein, partial [Acidobacteriota bacterium]